MNIDVDTSSASRPYRQHARAAATERTRVAILEATVALAFESGSSGFALADVAGRAGVSVQTVLRHYGSRDALMEAAIDYGAAQVGAERRLVSDDVATSIRVLFDHYEHRGDGVIRLLAQEPFDERVRRVTESGRRLHREWVEDLAHRLAASPSRDDVIDQLVIVTDVYAWKLLRRDMGLERHAAERRVVSMVEAIATATATPTREGGS